MKRSTLIKRSLTHYWRTNLGVILGSAVAATVLIGALVVGDSVRFSLKRIALQRLGETHAAMATGERLFTQNLTQAFGDARPVSAVLDLPAIARTLGADSREANNNMHLIGVDDAFWQIGGLASPLANAPPDSVAINTHLAAKLNVALGDNIQFRITKPSALSRDMPLGSETDDAIRLNLTVAAILTDENFGRFSLNANQIPPLNAYLPLALLQTQAQTPDKANTLLIGAKNDAGNSDDNGGDDETLAATLNAALRAGWSLPDAALELRELGDEGVVELRSSRVFLDTSIVTAATSINTDAQQILTYFVDKIAAGEKADSSGGADSFTPYSMVTATARDMPDDHIIINQWLADDLKLAVGDSLTLTYSRFGDARKITKHNATFSVHAIQPNDAPGGDRHLMPPFPGLADATSMDDWDPPQALGINLKLIREQDEDYWDKYRGTPKAFVTLNWADANWTNQYGPRTAIRWPLADHTRDQIETALQKTFDPASIGFVIRPLRAQALAASTSGTDFSGLFIGLSFFIIFAALLLTSLLFILGVEQRTPEIGTLLALGFTPKQVRRLWLKEGAILATIGSILGLIGAVAYTKIVIFALTTQWQDAAPIPALHYHAQPATLIGGVVGSVLVALGSMAYVMRKQANQPVRALLAARFGVAPSANPRQRAKRNLIIAGCCIGAAVAIVTSTAGNSHAAGAFFGAGGLLLFAGLFLASALLRGVRSGDPANNSGVGGGFTTRRLAWRNASRRIGRSLATISMLACGCFLVTAINAFKHDASDAANIRHSGTGGFAIYAQTQLPVLSNLNTAEGLETFALDSKIFPTWTPSTLEVRGNPGSFVQMRLRPGDDASCLNLNKPQSPSLLGVDPAQLASRDAYIINNTLSDLPEGSNAWTLLDSDSDFQPDAPVPAFIDASVATYILKKKLGDTIEYTDDAGQPFNVQIVGLLGNSILQGNLIISEKNFRHRFPSISGYRVFTIDASPETTEQTQRALERGLADLGISAMPAPDRLALFLKMENTYLSIFGVLGGLGLILGCVGLGLLVMRNVLERRAEFGLLRAFGFQQPALRKLVLIEHTALLALGLTIGAAAAFLAISPALQKPGAQLPTATIALTLATIAISGVLWTLGATVLALKGSLMAALRSE